MSDIKLGNVPNSDLSDTSNIIFTDGENVRKENYADVKADIIGSDDLLTNQKKTKASINEIVQDLLDTGGYGVINGGVVSAQSTANMTVQVTECALRTATGARQIGVTNSSITITAADTTNPRVDIIYIDSTGTIQYLQGTPAANPVAPSTPTGGQLLAQISVASNQTTITNSNITDCRKMLISTDQLNALLSKKANQSDVSNPNLLINGDFRINQRNVSGTVTLAANTYGHDRWKAGASGCTYTFSTSNGTTTITITAGSLIQVIEGNNLETGTYVMSWEGTATGKIGSGILSASGVSASVTGGSNLNVEFSTGTLTNIKLEKGTIATPFSSKSYGEELALCQRYYENNFLVAGHAVVDSNGKAIMFIPYKVTKRIKPTVSTDSSLLSSCLSEVGYITKTPATIAYADRGINGTMIIFTGLTDIIGYAVTIADNNALKNLITADAEIY
jgi:hypothetical protein